jgi:hypothetical protein
VDSSNSALLISRAFKAFASSLTGPTISAACSGVVLLCASASAPVDKAVFTSTPTFTIGPPKSSVRLVRSKRAKWICHSISVPLESFARPKMTLRSPSVVLSSKFTASETMVRLGVLAFRSSGVYWFGKGSGSCHKVLSCVQRANWQMVNTQLAHHLLQTWPMLLGPVDKRCFTSALFFNAGWHGFRR